MGGSSSKLKDAYITIMTDPWPWAAVSLPLHSTASPMPDLSLASLRSNHLLPLPAQFF